MSNNLTGLNTELATALRDTSYATWTTGEIDGFITRAVARLYPRHLYQFQEDDYTQGLTTGTYLYDIPSAIVSLTRIDLVDSDGNEFGPLGGVWEVAGNLEDGTAQLHISPTIVDNIGGTARYAGAYGRYDTTSRLIPDSLVELVIARGTVSALARVQNDRERFKAWAAQAQASNVSVNEMIQLKNDAEATEARLNNERRTWRMPMPGRIP